MKNPVAAADRCFPVLILVIATTSGVAAADPIISPAQAKSWHAIYTIEKPRTASDKAWNANRRKLGVEGAITEKSLELKIDRGDEYPLMLKSDESFDDGRGGIEYRGIWTDVVKGESGIFQAVYDNRRSGYVIDMGRGYKSHNSYSDYTVTLQRGR
ncbi:MAG TPA: hypothetical protein VEC35_11050 [Noviherbaspirillum sp.]|nr:hypothetical protein [Noviherbaspirillum sp.]